MPSTISMEQLPVQKPAAEKFVFDDVSKNDKEQAPHLFLADVDDDASDSFVDVPLDNLWPERAPELNLAVLGVPTPEMRTFTLMNKMGMTVTVEDEFGNLFMTGTGKFRPIGYNFSLYDTTGSPVFSLVSKKMHRRETYEWQQPDGTVLATIAKGMVQKKTSLHLHAGRDMKQQYDVKCKSTKLFGGQFNITSASGELLGYIKREVKKGVISKQQFTVVVGPNVDPYLVITLALTCNCVWNERPWAFWGALATGMMIL